MRNKILDCNQVVTDVEVNDLTSKIFKGNDMISYLVNLVRSNGKVLIPEYHAETPTVIKSNENILSNKNRHGKVIGLTTNKDSFKVSIKILDENVLDGNLNACYRNFSIIDCVGNAYSGLDKLKTGLGIINMDGSYLYNKGIGNLFGSDDYINIKLMLARMELEKEFCKNEMTRIAQVVTLPKVDKEKVDYIVSASEKVSVMCHYFSASGNFTGQFQAYPDTLDGYLAVQARKNKLSYGYWELKLAAKIIEMSFINDNGGKFSPISQMSWTLKKVKRTEYNQVVIQGVEILYRQKETPITMGV